ncbi:hypothetical protein FSOLCH5_013463 [Fusarium solani]|uniref:Heterokaryon incompatibility protein-domain-containing protein n=1 Tax=Fusarium solani TaxID=169388 RepID=A0A9P9GQC1_FUSSL|nr:heterokaryon incompatibility protein-domain-containing protein [Fusarium solani]KAH7243784.1 heterokaryon incompatibility protein-domain-containing protein [Fusarium solani]
MLCDKCKHIKLPHSHEPSYLHLCLVRHHATFDDLIASAEKGCQICLYFRPFIEYSRSRRQGLAERSQSDCSSSDAIGRPPDDPFESVHYGPTDNLVDGFRTEYGGSEPLKFSVGCGGFYEYDFRKDKYGYFEDSDEWNARRIEEQEAQITADDAEYEAELSYRLDRLGLGLDSENKDSESDENGRDSIDPELQHAEKIRATRTQQYEEIQWMLTTKGCCDGPEQLWVTLSHQSGSSELDTSANDDFCTATLTAGSIDAYSLEEGVEICLNGVRGYTRYTFASMHPEIWQYNPDFLSIPQKRPKKSLRPVLEFYQHRRNTFRTNPAIYSREVVRDPTAFSVLELARSWLNKCVKSHDLCEMSGNILTPSRLIDVGDGRREPVRLHIVGPEEKALPYATLSHCWGSTTSAITKLLQENLASMVQEINMEMLAKNFQDALVIARRLHLRYLWIDSLCIIQNSPEDWEAEAAKMGQYYHGSEVTICAVAASHCQHGILRPRAETQKHPRVDTDAGTFYLRPLLPDSVTVTDAFSMSDIRNPILTQPWNGRAWTLQERLFSRRVLYFTEEQMIWQCRSRFFAEDGQYSHLREPGGTNIVKRNIVDVLDYRRRFIGKEKKPAPPSIRSTQWYTLVQKYTRRHLTFPRDKLPALSGLAREVHDLTKARYVAGLWVGNSNSIVTGLMWSPVRDSYDGTQPPRPSLANNGSPSWSWTSLVAEIEHGLAEEDVIIVRQPSLDPEFVAVQTTPATSDPFGTVKGGEFVLRCWLYEYAGVRTYHELRKTGKVYDWADTYGNVTSSDPDSPRADPFAVFDMTQPDDLWKNEGPALEEDDQIACTLPQRRRGFNLAFIAYTNPFEEGEHADKEHAEQHFLLLGSVSNGQEHVYKRVGIAVTEAGTLFAINSENGWKRQRITIV